MEKPWNASAKRKREHEMSRTSNHVKNISRHGGRTTSRSDHKRLKKKGSNSRLNILRGQSSRRGYSLEFSHEKQSWLFSDAQLAQTPSIRRGISLPSVRTALYSSCRLIETLGKKLSLWVLWIEWFLALITTCVMDAITDANHTCWFLHLWLCLLQQNKSGIGHSPGLFTSFLFRSVFARSRSDGRRTEGGVCMPVLVHAETLAHMRDYWQTVAITCLFVAAKIEDGRKRFCDTVVAALFLWRKTKAKKGSHVGATCFLSCKGFWSFYFASHLLHKVPLSPPHDCCRNSTRRSSCFFCMKQFCYRLWVSTWTSCILTRQVLRKTSYACSHQFIYLYLCCLWRQGLGTNAYYFVFSILTWIPQFCVTVSALTREEHTAHWSKRRFSAPNCQYVNEHSARQVCWTCQSGASNTHSESTHTLLVSKPTYVCVFRREKLLPPLSLWFVCFKRMVRVSNSLLVTNVRAFRRRDYWARHRWKRRLLTTKMCPGEYSFNWRLQT